VLYERFSLRLLYRSRCALFIDLDDSSSDLYSLYLHDALPISRPGHLPPPWRRWHSRGEPLGGGGRDRRSSGTEWSRNDHAAAPAVGDARSEDELGERS